MRKYCAVVILSIIIMLTGCAGYGKIDNSDKYADIIAIAEYTAKQNNSGELEIGGGPIYKGNLDKYEKNEDISEIFSTDEYLYKSAMYDKDTVIIQRDVIFQSVKGYIATKKDALDTVHDKSFRYPTMNVSSSFGYDGNIVYVESDLGEFEEWHLYRYNAGL